MNLVRQMMHGHNQCEIGYSRMSIEERVVNEVFGLAMAGGAPTVNGHYNPHAANHYPRRTVGHDHLPERTTVNGSTFYVRHCVFNFGTNDLSFDFDCIFAYNDNSEVKLDKKSLYDTFFSTASDIQYFNSLFNEDNLVNAWWCVCLAMNELELNNRKLNGYVREKVRNN